MQHIRKTILKSFQQPETHPTEDEIYKVISQKINLTKEEFDQHLAGLVQENEVYKIISTDNKPHYGKKKGEHYHFICLECGKVKDFFLEAGALDMMSSYIQKIVHSYGRVKKINLSVHGNCHECEK